MKSLHAEDPHWFGGRLSGVSTWQCLGTTPGSAQELFLTGLRGPLWDVGGRGLNLVSHMTYS